GCGHVGDGVVRVGRGGLARELLDDLAAGNRDPHRVESLWHARECMPGAHQRRYGRTRSRRYSETVSTPTDTGVDATSRARDLLGVSRLTNQSLTAWLHGLPGVDQVGAEARAASLGTRSIKT